MHIRICFVYCSVCVQLCSTLSIDGKEDIYWPCRRIHAKILEYGSEATKEVIVVKNFSSFFTCTVEGTTKQSFPFFGRERDPFFIHSNNSLTGPMSINFIVVFGLIFNA
jgi:hypothetical protein